MRIFVRCSSLVCAVGLTMSGTTVVASATQAAQPAVTPAVSAIRTVGGAYTERTLTGPARVRVYASLRPVATFTKGARTVTLRGPARTFREPSTTTATVRSRTWVRLLPSPFAGKVNYRWLRAKLGSTRPDVLAVATRYTAGAAPVVNGAGLSIAGNADYGPKQPDGTRAEGSDFNDYLGLPWNYGTSTDAPESDQFGSLDCSGFVRMVFGYRSGIPLTLNPNGVGLPRRSTDQATSGPGVLTVRNSGSRPASTSRLKPGDLVFFDANSDDGSAVDHVGIFLGNDSAGAPRFISSRKTANGPTLGDLGGKSLLSGAGLYSTSWRSARRL